MFRANEKENWDPERERNKEEEEEKNPKKKIKKKRGQKGEAVFLVFFS